MPKIKKIEEKMEVFEMKDENGKIVNDFPESPVETPAAQIEEILDGTDKTDPPKMIESTEKLPLQRNRLGLLENVEYKFRDDGFIDWRAMIKPEYLFLNGSDAKQKEKMEKKYGKKFYEIDVVEDKVVDTDLLIGLAGLKELLRLRGYISVKFKNDFISYDMVVKTCRIQYIDNFETGRFNTPIFESCADATKDNVFSWYQRYLTTAAENRALARNIRNFLNIHICSKEEIGADMHDDSTPVKTTDSFSPHAVLQKRLDEKNTPFDKFKNFCNGKKIEGADLWEKVSDIPKNQVLSLLDMMAAREKETKEKA